MSFVLSSPRRRAIVRRGVTRVTPVGSWERAMLRSGERKHRRLTLKGEGPNANNMYPIGSIGTVLLLGCRLHVLPSL